MQKQPLDPEFLFEIPVECEISIAGVAQKRVSNAGKVRANLVHPSCFQADFDQVVAVEVLLDRVVGD